MMKTRFCFVVVLFLMVSFCNKAKAEHLAGAEIYWECITTGQDAGKFKFYVLIYKDCSSPSTVTAPQLNAVNVPTLNSMALSLALGYPQDVTPTECGLTCADAIPNLSMEKYLFESAPVTIPGPPPAGGYTFYYQPCCRLNVNNLVDSQFETTYYATTMYSFNGQNTDPCYDSSPRFAEPPITAQCAGYQIRYNSNAIDSDLDSLSYEFSEAVGSSGAFVAYAPGFSANEPLPGPNPITLNASTGQIEYDSQVAGAGRYTVVLAINAWRSGQLVSRSIRDMTFAFVACTEPNEIPQVSLPVWASPAGASGFSVSVAAGDLVIFTLEGIDTDPSTGAPENIQLIAEGAQFSSDFSNPNVGCLNAPCATLSNPVLPATGVGSVSTDFSWQTTCDHVGVYDECGNLSNTYNFLFKLSDDYCPTAGLNIANVSVTVVGEPVVESPVVHCVSTVENGDVMLSWNPVSDNSSPPSFEEYVVYHSTSANGPFTTIVGSIVDINAGVWTHEAASVNPPESGLPNYYQVRTKSGCNGQVLKGAVQTVSSIHLDVVVAQDSVILSWTPIVDPPLPSSNGSGQGLYQVYREYPAGNWELIATTFDLTYADLGVVVQEEVNYRVELMDALPCTSVSNTAGYLFTPVSSENEPEFHIFPNPSNGTFRLESGQLWMKGVQVFDSAGKLVYEDEASAPTRQLRIHITGPKGVFLVKTRFENGESVQDLLFVE